MNEIILIKPTLDYATDIMECKKEFLNNSDSLEGWGNLKDCLTVNEWLETLKKHSNLSTCPPDRVLQSTYLALCKSNNTLME